MTRTTATNNVNPLDGFLTAGTGDGVQLFVLTITAAVSEVLVCTVDGVRYTAVSTAADISSAAALFAVLNVAAVTDEFIVTDVLDGTITVAARTSGKRHDITGSGGAGSNVAVTDDADLNVDGSTVAVIGKLQPEGTEVFMITELTVFMEDTGIETGEFGTEAALVHGLHLYVATNDVPIQSLGVVLKNSDLARIIGATYEERNIGTAVVAVLGKLDLRETPIFLFGGDSDALCAQIQETMATLTRLRIQAKGYRGGNFDNVMQQYKKFVNR